MTPELNRARSVGGVEINTSKCGPLNWEHLCPSGPRLQGPFGGHLEPGTHSRFPLLSFAAAFIHEQIPVVTDTQQSKDCGKSPPVTKLFQLF